MADFNSSLPVRTQNNGDVAAKIVDATTPSQGLAVDASGRIVAKLDDGAGNAITSQVNGTQRALDVGIDVAGVQIDPRAIRALTSADVVTVQNSSVLTTKDSADGPVTPGTVAANSILTGGQFNTTLPTLATAQQSAIQLDSSGRVLVSQPTASALNATVVGTVAVSAITSSLPAGTNALGSVQANLQVAGAAVTVSNPVPVTISTSTPGTPVQNYQTSAALAAGASVTLTYTVATGHTFTLEQVYATASGKIKFTVQNGTTTIFVGFTSTANPNGNVVFSVPPVIAAAGTVNVIISNIDVSAFDVYALIEGNQN